jgi:cytochrome c5
VNTEQHDKSFVGTFLIVLGFLGAFTVTIWIIAKMLGSHEADPAESAKRIEERIKPVGQVATDAAQLLAVSSAPAGPARAPMGGEEIVTKVCGACHGTGVLNAPKIGDKAEWSKRKAAGMKALLDASINGKNAMPARGGDPSLSDAEVKAAVEHMLKQSGA